MSPEYYRRGRNMYTAIGVMFIVIAIVALVRQMLFWSPGFVVDFLFNGSVNSEKIAVGTIVLGVSLIVLGYRRDFDHSR